jgi:hypothetical protein
MKPNNKETIICPNCNGWRVEEITTLSGNVRYIWCRLCEGQGRIEPGKRVST